MCRVKCAKKKHETKVSTSKQKLHHFISRVACRPSTVSWCSNTFELRPDLRLTGSHLEKLSNGKKKSALSPSDPLDWSCVHVQKWLLWTEHLYRLPHDSTMFQGLSGRDLCSMTEADFRQRSLQFGDVLYAHLDIWRSGENNRNIMPSGGGTADCEANAA